MTLAEIGVYFNRFDESEHENPYRAEALGYIMNGMEVSDELKIKIEEYDAEYENTDRSLNISP